MELAEPSGQSIEYFPYRFGQSGLVFRGPRRKLKDRYIAVIGGSETYGKFLLEPYPVQLEEILGVPVANYGCLHASVGTFAQDDTVMDSCQRADITVVQVMGAGNNSNRLYTVHPRRNDRFLKATSELRRLYPDVDFTRFNFTRHMLNELSNASQEAFAELCCELRAAWVERMKLLIDQIGGRIVLLWVADRSPDEMTDLAVDVDPLFVDRDMLDELKNDITDLVEVVVSQDARDEGLENKVFQHAEMQAAAELPGSIYHVETAMALAEALTPVLEKDGVFEDMAGADDPPHAENQRLRAFR